MALKSIFLFYLPYLADRFTLASKFWLLYQNATSVYDGNRCCRWRCWTTMPSQS